MPEYNCPGPVNAVFAIAGGSVDVTAEDRTTVAVEVTPYDGTEASQQAAARTVVEFRGDTLHVSTPDIPTSWLWRKSGKIRVDARVPSDSRLVLRLASADATCRGRYDTAQIGAASGNLTIEQVTGDLNGQTASGDIIGDRIGGDVSVHTASGNVTLRAVDGAVSARSASGNLTFGAVGGSMRIGTASGEVRVDQLQRGEVGVKSASGDVTLGVLSGTTVWLDLNTASGHVQNSLAMTRPPGDPEGKADLKLRVRTSSGDIEVRRVEVPRSQDQLTTA